MPSKIKKATPLLAVHKTFDKDLKGNRKSNWYVADGKKISFLKETEVLKFIDGLNPGTVIRLSAVNSADDQLIDLHERGMMLHHAHWHSLGIEKNQEPEVIVASIASAAESLFREFKPDRTIADLRDALSLRNATLDFYNEAKKRILQVARNKGIADGKVARNNPSLKVHFDTIDDIFDGMVSTTPEGKELSLEKNLNELASTVRECQIFNEVAGIKTSYVSAASVVAYSGGIDRFPDVASFWHFFGQHVTEGKAPKRKAGTPNTWSPAGRSALWCMADSIIKNGDPKWRAFYNRAKAEELAVHAEKHPGCKTPEGHSGARARRKMTKQILKEFYVKVTGNDFEEDHVSVPRQPSVS